MRKREALPCVTIHHWDKLALSYSGPPNLEGGHPMATLVSKTANFLNLHHANFPVLLKHGVQNN
jgi:hypothetical protein